MKPKKFLKKTVDALEDELQKRGISDDYTIYWNLDDDTEHPIMKVLFPNEIAHYYDLESFRQQHKASDISFGDFVDGVLEPVLAEIDTFRGIHHISPETEARYALGDNPTKEEIIQKVFEYIKDNRSQITELGYAFEDLQLKEMIINGTPNNVIIPNIDRDDAQGLHAPVCILSDAKRNVSVDFTYEMEQSIPKCGQIILDRMKNIPVFGYETVKSMDSLQGMLTSRLLSKNEYENGYDERITNVINEDLNLYEVYGVTLYESDETILMDLAPEMFEKYNLTLDGLKEAIKDHNEGFAVEPLSSEILVVSNMNMEFGAAQIFKDRVADHILNHYNMESALIVPSSVHKVMVAKDTPEMRESLCDLPELVNQTLKPDIILGNEVFEYNFRTKEITRLPELTNEREEVETEQEIEQEQEPVDIPEPDTDLEEDGYDLD